MPLITSVPYNVVPPTFGENLGSNQNLMIDSAYALPGLGKVSSSKIVLGARDLSVAAIDSVIVDISGTTLTTGANAQIINAGSVSWQYPEIEVLDSGRAYFHAYTVDTDIRYSRVMNFTGSTFGVGGSTTVDAADSVRSSATLVDTDKLFVMWNDANVDTQVEIQTVSGTTITQNTDTQLDASIQPTGGVAKMLDSTRALTLYLVRPDGITREVRAVVSTISGTTQIPGTPVILDTNPFVIYDVLNIVPIDNTRVAVTWKDGSNNYRMNVLTISGSPQTTITPGTTQTIFTSANPNRMHATLMDTNFVSLVYNDIDDSDKGKLVNATITGTTASFGSPITFESGTLSGNRPSIIQLSGGTGVIAWINGSSQVIGKVVN